MSLKIYIFRTYQLTKDIILDIFLDRAGSGMQNMANLWGLPFGSQQFGSIENPV